MAANILARQFKIPLSDYYSIDVSVDSHVKRVFQRLKLVDSPDTAGIIFKARVISPEFPGLVDHPCFEIGRSWCHARTPNCESCFMSDICPSSTSTNDTTEELIRHVSKHPSAIEFKNDDEGYLSWLTGHPSGFVLNVKAKANPKYVVLHRASCRLISSDKLQPGAYTSNDFRKWCAEEVKDLQSAAKLEGRKDGTFSKRCKRCQPR
jgi:hypothetical protein